MAFTKENFLKHVSICEKVEKEIGKEKIDRLYGKRFSRLMDLASADIVFNMRLDDLMNADDENFYHDVLGLWEHSNRETYPCTFGTFVPRFARKEMV